jgi:hypothetical protein
MNQYEWQCHTTTPRTVDGVEDVRDGLAGYRFTAAFNIHCELKLNEVNQKTTSANSRHMILLADVMAWNPLATGDPECFHVIGSLFLSGFSWWSCV